VNHRHSPHPEQRLRDIHLNSSGTGRHRERVSGNPIALPSQQIVDELVSLTAD